MYNRSRFQGAPVHFANILEGLLNHDYAAADCKPAHSVSVNIRENADQYEMHLIAPGLQKEDFKIDVEKNLLTVSFGQKEEEQKEGEKWLRQEYKIKSFKRSFNLNDKIDAASINAIYENGILRLSLPKKEKEEAKAVSISVQ